MYSKDKRSYCSFINLLILGGILCFLILRGENILFSLGGSLIFISIIGVVYYLSLVHRDFSSYINCFSVILSSLIGLNIIAYIEHTKGFSIEVMIGIFIFQIIILLTIYSLIEMPFGIETILSNPERIELRKRVVGFIFLTMFTSFAYTLVTASFFMALKEEFAVKQHMFSFSSMCLLWIIIGLLLLLIYKRKLLNTAISHIVVIQSNIDMSVVKKSFFLAGVIILCMGSALEIMRGLWIIWISSWLSFTLITIALWKSWKYVAIKEKDSHVSTIKDDLILAVPSLLNPSTALKFVGIFTLIGLIYIFLLFGILYVSPR